MGKRKTKTTTRMGIHKNRILFLTQVCTLLTHIKNNKHSHKTKQNYYLKFRWSQAITLKSITLNTILSQLRDHSKFTTSLYPLTIHHSMIKVPLWLDNCATCHHTLFPDGLFYNGYMHYFTLQLVISCEAVFHNLWTLSKSAKSTNFACLHNVYP